jgi:outer membrane lipoprotein-sorting protein
MVAREAEDGMAEPDKASGLARGLARAALAFGLLAGLAVPAFAQSVPLPKPRPNPQSAPPTVTGTIARPSTPPTNIVPAAQAQPNPISNPFAALLGKPEPSAALKPEQRAVIERIEKYLSNTQILSGQFVQVGPDGRRTQGEFHIQKPGKVRFDYDPPSPIDIIADGETVVVRDRSLATQDVYPLSQTPLRFLLSDHVNLMKDTHLVAVYADDVFVTVVIEEKTGIVGTSRLMIMFSAKDMQLKQWTVTDPQGFDTTVAVYNLDTSNRPDPAMFNIDFTKYRN